MQETQEVGVQSLGWEDPQEEEMATHSSIFAWEIPWTEESERLTTCYNINKSWKHYAEWPKPDTKDHISYDSIYMKLSV